jgi:hypothetical protein
MKREDHVGAPFPEADVLNVGARRARWAGEVGVEDGELVTLVFEEPRFGVDVEVEPIGTLVAVPSRDVALGDCVAKRDESARLVGSLGFGVLDERRAHLGRDHHQMRSSID